MIDEFAILEARYDAMPPRVAQRLARGNTDPLSRRHHALQMEIAFARRMFRASRRAGRTGPGATAGISQDHRDDCRHWWHRYRKARASAAQLRGLMALQAMIGSIESRA